MNADTDMPPSCVPATRVTETGSFRLSLPRDAAFDLFTPSGEAQWLKEFRPIRLTDHAERDGCVFLTDMHGEVTIWTIVRANREQGFIQYSRVTPGSRAGLVSVRLRPERKGTSVDVTYDMTALSPEAAADLGNYQKDELDAMLAGWARLIEEWLAAQKPNKLN